MVAVLVAKRSLWKFTFIPEPVELLSLWTPRIELLRSIHLFVIVHLSVETVNCASVQSADRKTSKRSEVS